jgi:hypothetical protein
MSKIVRVSAVFDFYPEEDDLMTEMSDEQLQEYAVDCVVEDFDRFVKYDEVRDALAVEVLESEPDELTGADLETITGHFGEMLDNPELDETTRVAIESVYKKVAKKLGVWE